MEDPDKSLLESGDEEDSRSSRASQLSTTDKPHVCSYPGCSSAFSKPSRLLQHTRVHTGEVSKIFSFVMSSI